MYLLVESLSETASAQTIFGRHEQSLLYKFVCFSYILFTFHEIKYAKNVAHFLLFSGSESMNKNIAGMIDCFFNIDMSAVTIKIVILDDIKCV